MTVRNRVKPARTDVKFNNIPQEIKDLKQWVVWRYDLDKQGRWTKVPYQAQDPSRKASSTSEETWESYTAAYASYADNLDLDGIGFVLAEDDGITGVDLDHCIDDAGNLLPWAQEIVDLLNSYTEITPSGQGLRIFIEGKLPGTGRKKDNIEVYDKARFLTVTGHHLRAASMVIQDRQQQMDTFMDRHFSQEKTPQVQEPEKSILGDDELIKKASAAKNGQKFKQLWGGDTSGYPSSSEADAALCSILAFYTGRDPVQIDRLFRQSGLMRDKWNEKHGEKTYGQMTIEKAVSLCPDRHTPVLNSEASAEASDPWNKARSTFPKQLFPWHVMPGGVAVSLQQLARSCATSPVALPGAAFALLASVLGSTVSVSPKSSWCEPMIFWMADIRPSGDGKTPAARALCKPLYDAQKTADAEYQTAYEKWRSTPSADREVEPKRARGYFITDLTLEGLRDDITGHGGTVAVLDEISSFLSAQNQYKSKGSDRESWLSLHDGHPFRVVRSGKTYTVAGARVSIFGGVQPEVWHKIFGGDGGLYLSDGTVFRFLPTYEGSQFYELTSETWSEENQTAWENTLNKAMKWADDRISPPDWEPLRLSLDDEARQCFLDWRNELHGTKPLLPRILQGFIPKIVGYALRLAGILHCMDRFSRGKEPAETLTLEDIKKGIETARFYLGHIVHAAEALCAEKTGSEIEITEQVLHLARTLKALQPELDSGRLAVGYIHERFNQDCMPEIKFSNPKAMGTFLRSLGLTIPEGNFSANGKRSVKALLWDEKTESFIEQVCNGRDVCKPSIDGDSQAQTLDNQRPRSLQGDDSRADITDIPNTTSEPEEPHQANTCRHLDHRDHCSEQNSDSEADDPVREGNDVVY